MSLKHAIASLAIVLLSAGLVLVAGRWLPLIRGAENATYDVRMARLGAAMPQSEHIVLVTVTESTLAQFPYRAPLDRAFLADLLEHLGAVGVGAIGLDILLDQPTEPAKDARLAKVLAASPVPIIAITGDQRDGLTAAQQSYIDTALGALTAAFASLPGDVSDGGVRRHDPVRIGPDGPQRSLAAALAAIVGVDPPETSFHLGYRGRPDASTPPFATYPAEAASLLPDDWLAGKLVLIGADLPHADRIRTPFSIAGASDMAGVEAHAHALDHMLEGRAAPRLGVRGIVVLLLAAALAGVVVVSLAMPLWAMLLLGAALLAGYWVSAFAGYAAGWPLLPVIQPSLGFLLAAGLGSAVLTRRERARRRFLRQAFAHYVSPAVVDRLAADPSKLALGGERREMTFLFTDISGFTRLTEALDPPVMVSLLNAYLDGMCRIVLESGGTVDKLVGDAVHAFFGAPDDQADHAARAVACALKLDAHAARFAAEQQAAGIAFGGTRIGVTTGPAIVGNFGGTVFDYTAHGDVVNTAARLEAANAALGTRICVAEATTRQCPDTLFRPIGVLGLRGKARSVAVFEPLAGSSAPAIDAYITAYGLLKARDTAARDAFQALAAAWPDDRLVARHLERLEAGETGVEMTIETK